MLPPPSKQPAFLTQERDTHSREGEGSIDNRSKQDSRRELEIKDDDPKATDPLQSIDEV